MEEAIIDKNYRMKYSFSVFILAFNYVACTRMSNISVRYTIKATTLIKSLQINLKENLSYLNSVGIMTA